MKAFFTLFLSLFIIISNQAFAQIQVKGVGFGINQEQARNEALADVASQISIYVQATTGITVTEITGKGYNEEYIQKILTQTQLPILGAKLSYKNVKKEVECEAILDASVVSLYQNEVKQIHDEASSLLKSDDLNDLSRLLTLSENYSKYRVILTHFKQKAEDFPISVSEIQKRFENKAGNISSMNEFSELIKRLFKDETYYVFAPEVSNSKEITPFSASIRQRIITALSTVDSPSNVTFLVTGHYVILEDRIELHIKTIDNQQKVVQSAAFRFLPSAYEGLRFKPETADMESMMKQGLLLGNELRPELRTSLGKSNLLFYSKEQVELFVKMNKPGYLYIMGHVNNVTGKFSYLIPINGTATNRDFVLFINADDANKWISLGSFDVEEPFGTEILQVFASSEDVVDKIPRFYINDDGYPVIGTSPNEVVVKSRGLIQKKKAGAQVGETSLTYTTIAQK